MLCADYSQTIYLLALHQKNLLHTTITGMAATFIALHRNAVYAKYLIRGCQTLYSRDTRIIRNDEQRTNEPKTKQKNCFNNSQML